MENDGGEAEEGAEEEGVPPGEVEVAVVESKINIDSALAATLDHSQQVLVVFGCEFLEVDEAGEHAGWEAAAQEEEEDIQHIDLPPLRALLRLVYVGDARKGDEDAHVEGGIY